MAERETKDYEPTQGSQDATVVRYAKNLSSEEIKSEIRATITETQKKRRGAL